MGTRAGAGAHAIVGKGTHAIRKVGRRLADGRACVSGGSATPAAVATRVLAHSRRHQIRRSTRPATTTTGMTTAIAVMPAVDSPLLPLELPLLESFCKPGVEVDEVGAELVDDGVSLGVGVGVAVTYEVNMLGSTDGDSPVGVEIGVDEGIVLVSDGVKDDDGTVAVVGRSVGGVEIGVEIGVETGGAVGVLEARGSRLAEARLRSSKAELLPVALVKDMIAGCTARTKLGVLVECWDKSRRRSARGTAGRTLKQRGANGRDNGLVRDQADWLDEAKRPTHSNAHCDEANNEMEGSEECAGAVRAGEKCRRQGGRGQDVMAIGGPA
ncbi:hypothetical protein FH972_025848 [Carpinus fangiana]|uniref:Uncharacterized protein n=1 Tax=Carpinus fangiana TaxID=176857 RepID=A0A5N6L2K7_9ROSI|nr:hypothetical protein FH972_025848 [Carpinus fangiana]